MKCIVATFLTLSLWIGVARAHEGQLLDLKDAPSDHQVESVGYCQGKYAVKLRDGSVRQFREFDLRFKTDSGPNGPRRGVPALIPAGMAGDRAFLIFADPEEMKGFIKRAC